MLQLIMCMFSCACLQAALFAQAANDGRDGLLNLVADVVKAIRDRKRAG